MYQKARPKRKHQLAILFIKSVISDGPRPRLFAEAETCKVSFFTFPVDLYPNKEESLSTQLRNLYTLAALSFLTIFLVRLIAK